MTDIVLDHVHVAYPGASSEALDDVSLRIPLGQHVCILGGNGSGKSTLLQLVNALIVPTRGDVRVCGMSTGDPDLTLSIRSRTASVFQQPEDQMVTSVVADDVAFGPENLCVAQPEIARRVDTSLEAVDMAGFSHSDPSDLSGGQTQRVAIAGALAMEPQIMLLDEPCAMLDAESRADVRSIIADQHARGITVLHVTHFMEDALAAERAIVLSGGRVAYDGTPEDLFSQAELVNGLGLEMPRAEADRQATRAEAADAADSPRAVIASEPSIEFDRVSFSYACARNPRKRARKTLLSRIRLPWKRARGPLSGEFTTRRPHETAPTGGDRAENGRVGGGRAESVPVGASTRTSPAPIAVDHLSFRAYPGTLTALIGRTGSGKSTTAELACALKLPTSGTVRVMGIETADLTRRRELRGSVGFVAQLPERQLFAETVFEDVAFGPRNLGLTPAEVDRRVREALFSVNLQPTDSLLQASPFTLSGGQQRSVALAGVLAMDQPILVLDEPMAGLDPAGRARVRDLLRSLRRAGRTLLMVTHSMEDVRELADQVVELDHGRRVSAGDEQAGARAGAATAEPGGGGAHGIAG